MGRVEGTGKGGEERARVRGSRGKDMGAGKGGRDEGKGNSNTWVNI